MSVMQERIDKLTSIKSLLLTYLSKCNDETRRQIIIEELKIVKRQIDELF